MASNNRNVGIFKILIGDVPSDGATMPEDSAMTSLGKIKIDSAALEKEDDENTPIKVQEDMSIDMDLLTDVGATSFTFETYDFSFPNIIRAMGGSVALSKWYQSTNVYRGKEVCLRIVTKAGKGLHAVMDFPRVKMSGQDTGTFGEGDPSTIKFTFTKLTPTNDSGVNQPESIRYYLPAAPTNPVTDDTNDTFEWDYTENFTDATEYEYSTDTGSTWNDCTVNPQTGITGAVAVGALLVRVKADTTATYPYVSGYTLANTVEFTV